MRRPLSVVGTDQEALQALLSLHACPEPRILDVTHNRGRMWARLPYKPHRSDRDPALFEEGFTDTVADFRALPFEAGSFDVIVFDPPHIDHAFGQNLSGDWSERYGLHDEEYRDQGILIADLFQPFMAEAHRVLVPETGLVLAKIADSIHSQRSQWQHIDLIQAGKDHGLTACDLMIRVSWSRGSMIDPRWRRVCHVRTVHTYWLCFRNGTLCVSPTAQQADIKPRTTDMFQVSA